MPNNGSHRGRRTGHWVVTALAAAALSVGTGALPVAADDGSGPLPTVQQVNDVSDVPGRAAVTDPKLVNSWGLTSGPTTPVWSANNGSDSSTLYTGGAGGTAVTKVSAIEVAVAGGPTGIAFNDTTAFPVTGPGGSGPARFIFATESGDIMAWNPTASPSAAVQVAHVPGAIFKGLALVHTPAGPFLLAPDFHNGRVQAFDGNFDPVQTPPQFFQDRRLPRGFAPFGIAALGDAVYVSYAKQDADAADEVQGQGLGVVDRYTDFGLSEQRIASRGTLDAPWGMAIAPASFGRTAGSLLVGNFGDGRINVFSADGGHFRGQLREADGTPVVIDGLWALLPGTATSGGTDAVWFSAGPDDEAHGLLGRLLPTG
ncbi:MAG: TIGR03118 family protein [Streptosporangiales bacterium]|nr:TIGR03118 family protein [Streptosporangiales bacterium]MBO0889486.1 TIGR03118 family protein [Acidothermales bacterium]